ncbi:MAG TPA: glycosyl hydrolase family 5, partial [Treponema sp.]|nr:glycosyl hydrolase family 5 [Treponema sp.]
HGEDYRRQITTANKKGLAVFVTEWGTTKASGDGGVFEKETLEWTKFLAKKQISWANWSVNNKGEDSGVLKYNKDKRAEGGWKDEDLQPSGILVRQILRGEK